MKETEIEWPRKRILFRKVEGKRPLERPKGRWKDNINMRFTERL
jgi:hypothetical protein